MVALLLFTSLGVTDASAARRLSYDTQGFKHLFYPEGRPGVIRRGESSLLLESWSETIHLDDEEEIVREIRFSLRPSLTGTPVVGIPAAVIDASLGDRCELEGAAHEDDLGGDDDDSGDDDDDSETDDQESVHPHLQVEPFSQGVDHFGSPQLCTFTLPKHLRTTEDLVEGRLVVRRPRVARMEDRFSLYLPVQPLAGSTRRLSFSVVAPDDGSVVVEGQRWQVEVPRKALPGNRVRWSYQLENVRGLAMAPGVLGIAGRVPAMLVRSAATWDDIASEHRAWYRASSRLSGAVIPLAGRVLGQQDAAASVREAARLALDEISLLEEGARGGTWLLPQRAVRVVETGKGTAASRAALLMALLQAAEIRADVVFVSRSAQPVSPTRPVQFLNQVLVLVPGQALDGSGGPLFIDPSRDSSWIGALDERLLGRDAVLLGPEGARWLRLPSAPPRQHWTLTVREADEAMFDVNVEGLLSGAPAARVRSWSRAGQPSTSAPRADLAWLGGAFFGRLTIDVAEAGGTRLQLRASGRLEQSLAVPDGYLAAPRLPKVAPPNPFKRTWVYGRDALLFDVDLVESWTFRGRAPGEPMPEGRRVTPFWDLQAIGSWSGPQFNRRARVRFLKSTLHAEGAFEVESFSQFVRGVLGGVRAP